jgi:hypothetical protein
VIIQELAAKLGLEIDEGAFAVGEAIVHKLESGLLGIGAALGAYAGGIQALIHSTANAASAARKAAVRTGMSTDAIQELSAAADNSGLSAETLETGLIRLARATYAASTGSQEAQDTFSALGVSFYQADGKLKATDVLLQEVADKFATMPDGIQKTALAQRAFGRGGAELLPFLNKGAHGIEAMREEAREFGLVLDTETIQAAKEYKAANNDLEDSFRGLKYAIGGPLLKGAGDLAKAFAQLVSRNRKWIAGIVRKPYEIMRDALRFVAQHLFILKAALATVTLYIIGSHIPAVIAAISGITAWQVALFSATIASKVAAVAGVAHAVAIAAAWLAVAAAVVLVAEDIYTFLTGGESYVGDLTKAIDEWWDAAKFDPQKTGWGAFLDFLKTILWTVTHIGETIENWASFLTKGGATGKGVLGDVASWAFGAPPGAASAGPGTGLAGYSPLMPAAAFEAAWGPTALSPQASAASAGAGSVVNAPKVEAVFNIQAAPGADPAATGRETLTRWDDWWNSELQSQVPAVSPLR